MILYYLHKLGPILLFFGLFFGIVGLPIPDEILLTGTGVLLSQGKLGWFWSLFAAISGSILGITTSYLLGRWGGRKFIEKFGRKFGVSERKLKWVDKWFHKFGRWIMIIGYFIPIIRHLFGFFLGFTRLRFKTFAIYAYLGAILWITTFILIGYYFPHKIM